jgi:hypothetical protein
MGQNQLFNAKDLVSGGNRKEKFENYGIYTGLEFTKVIRKSDSDLIGFIFADDIHEAALFFKIANESDPKFDVKSRGDARRISDLLQIFLTEEDFDAFSENNYRDFMFGAADALDEKVGTKKVNIKLMPNSSNTSVNFPLYGKYIEEYVEGVESNLVITEDDQKYIDSLPTLPTNNEVDLMNLKNAA